MKTKPPTQTAALSPMRSCVCGREPYLNEALSGDDPVYSVECSWQCWRGPRLKTQRGAAQAWDKIMRFAVASRGR